LATAAPTQAQARQSVVVHTASATLEPLVSRLCAELASAGYAVSVDLSEPSEECARSKEAWIALATKLEDRAVVVSTVCFKGTEVSVAGPQANPGRLSISTAEALNGLRATAPSKVRERPRPTAAPAMMVGARPSHTISVGQELLIEPSGFPLQWGATFDMELGLTAHAAFVLGGFVPIQRAEIATKSAELRVGVSFLRVGLAMRYSLARFAVAGSLLVGPAYTRVTAKAISPYVGDGAFAPGVLGGAGLGVSYPDHGSVFAAAASRACILLPSPALKLPNEVSREIGPLFIEASLSIGIRL
jgi:hypothetical protein